MYLKGYRLRTASDTYSITLPKWDYGGDKPWTYTSWNNTLGAIRKISESDYPLYILDLDNLNLPEAQINNPSAFEEWLQEVLK